MSLLMDALKRAEASKQEATRATTPAPAEGLSLEPIASGQPATQALPELASHLAAVDADLAQSAPLAAPVRPPQSGAYARPEPSGHEIARNAFAAKLAADATRSRKPLWLALGGLATAALAIGIYTWYQINALSGGSFAPTKTQSAPATANRATLAPEQARPAIVSPPPATPIASPSSPAAATAATATPARQAAADTASGRSPQIRLTRTHPEADPDLLQGHANVERNDLEQAQRNFQRVLQRDPNNTDALLALSSIAQYLGHPGDAEGLAQRALVANPSDPAVQGAVLNGASAGTDPQRTESRLKMLLTTQPESAPLNFALGNLYAGQQRWPEAQQAYFNAVAAEGDNPDYLFNLAVSLDHIRQPRLAAQHYRLALEASGKRPAAFDRELARRRLAELQP